MATRHEEILRALGTSHRPQADENAHRQINDDADQGDERAVGFHVLSGEWGVVSGEFEVRSGKSEVQSSVFTFIAAPPYTLLPTPFLHELLESRHGRGG